jgi:outer membrane protein assembly factor BamB
MSLRVRVAAAAAMAVASLSACEASRRPSAPPTSTAAASASTSHSALPSGDSTIAGTPGTVAVAAANARTGKFLWRVPVDGDFQVFSGMVLDRGTLYGQWAGCADNNAGAAAISLATGKILWRTDKLYQGETLPDALAQSALGGVYVTGGGMDSGGVIVGIDVTTGKTRWRYALSGQQGEGIALDQLVLAFTTVPDGGRGATITGLDRATGKALWSSPLPAGADSWSTVAADDGHIFATHSGNDGDHTVAFAARTGKTLWEHDGRAPRPSRPGEHVVALQASTGVVGLDTDTGGPRWQRAGLTDMGDRVDTAGGRVVLASAPPTTVHIIDIATGKDAWTKRAGDVIVNRANGIVLSDDNARPTLYRAATGEPIGPPGSLPPETDQVTVPMQIDPDARVILARGCPGRG